MKSLRARRERRLATLLFCVLGTAAVYGALHWLARRLVYHNSSSVPQPAESYGLGLQDVWLRTRDGVKIHGWSLAAPEARVATLLLHGNAGNIGHRVPHLLEIAAAGSDVLIIDYCGYGGSQGSPSESGVTADAEAAYERLAGAGKPIVLHGESLGSAVAVELAARRPVAGLVLEAPFTSLRAMAGELLPLLGPLLLWGFDSKTRIAGLRVPLLVIHGASDATVPLRLGRELYDAAPGPKSFWTVAGADHNNLLEAAGPAYREHLRAFYVTR